MKGLTAIPGITVGHQTDLDGATGCTAIICEAGAVGGVSLRGSATGTEETPTLDPGSLAPLVHAIVLSGGSAFGLESISGVRHYLRSKKVGFSTAYGPVPIVAGAILFDLGIGNSQAYPGLEAGQRAAKEARDTPVQEGNIGAGTGATVGKALGMNHAMKGGLGSATIELNSKHSGVIVAALVAVNAFGDVVDENGKVVAGTRISPDSDRFASSESVILRGTTPPPLGNTTLAVVATNARLTRVQAKKLAEQGSLGLARTIRPAETIYDGDTVFALSHGDLPADITVLGIAAAQAVSRAIIRAVRAASTLHRIPGLG